jgi:hypothetical protein
MISTFQLIGPSQAYPDAPEGNEGSEDGNAIGAQTIGAFTAKEERLFSLIFADLTN